MKTIIRMLIFISISLLLLVSFGCNEVEVPTEGLVYELLEDGTGYAVSDYTGESLDVVVPSIFLIALKQSKAGRLDVLAFQANWFYPKD